MTKSSSAQPFHGVGRRKASVARVWLRPGKGVLTINGRSKDDYFTTPLMRTKVEQPFEVAERVGKFDVMVNVVGGGLHGQADATRLGIARALLATDEALRPVLKKNLLLRVDSRVKERKKYGQPGARRKFQFVKR